MPVAQKQGSKQELQCLENSLRTVHFQESFARFPTLNTGNTVQIVKLKIDNFLYTQFKGIICDSLSEHSIKNPERKTVR